MHHATPRRRRAAFALVLAGLLLPGQPAIAGTTSLIDPANPASNWRFDNGREFPGAKGSLAADASVEAQYRPVLRLDGDFTGGGNYVQAGSDLPPVALGALSFAVKAPRGMEQITLRLIDGTGQCHQFNLRIEGHGEWQRVRFPVARYFERAGTSAALELVKRHEGWGGAKDGKWHDPGKALYILVGRQSFGDALKGSLWISDIRADVGEGASAAADAYRESFETGPTPPEGWHAVGPDGSAGIVSETPFDGRRALRVQRAETQLNEETVVTGAAFAAAPGPWSLGGALRSALHSPDNSFAVRLDVVALDADGGVRERTTLVDQTGSANWRPFARQVDLPQGTTQARFVLSFHKTHGWCEVDALSAAPLEAKAEERLVERIVIGNRVVGNLFLPEEDVVFDLDVQSTQPLPADGRRAVITVRDYWGAEQLPPMEVALTRDGLVDKRFRHTAEIRIPKDGLQIGQYYEVQVAVPLSGYQDAAEFSGFARLPEAESRQHPAEGIPFTIRNWDSRIPDYFKLASRLGLRQIGTWGDSGWERIRYLGDKWYGGPRGVADVERKGWTDITEAELRQRAIDFMTKHKDNESLACVMLGNEPNERPERVAEKIRAYQIAYEALKSVKPDVKIVTTSVPALESFFAAGYHRYTDVYDFHVYETYPNVRQAIRRYKALGRKYGAEKPVWCTELGLNSQGQTRHAVAQEVVKKITAFFAEGGENVSWFTIMYPDRDGKARGTSGNAHNTFDCQYNQYNPRLDAIMCYAMVNGITTKSFVDEVQHADGVQSYLFRDAHGACFHVLWKEGARVDRGIPLPGVDAVRLIRIDGSSESLVPKEGVVTLGLSGEPVMLRYRQAAPVPLARELAPPALAVREQPPTVLKGGAGKLRVAGVGLTADALRVLTPPRWTADIDQDGADAVACTIAAPAETEARMGRVMIQRLREDGAPCAEIALSLAIMSPVSVEILADSRNAAGEPGIRAVLRNNGGEPASVSWTFELAGAAAISNGVFRLNELTPAQSTHLKGDTEGQATLEGGTSREARASLAAFEEQTLYRVRVAVTDDVGRRITKERHVGGFAAAARTGRPVKVDSVLDDPVWASAAPERIDGPGAVYRFKGGTPWRGPTDLSATWRAAWDDQALYLAIEVADDVHRVQFADGAIWNQDGLQFLFDPTRPLDEKAGKYDYSVGIGIKGPQAWCHLSGHSSVAEGAATAFQVAATDLAGSAGGKVYEISIPWSRLAPFTPASGANLGMNMILNEDDGDGRVGFSTWFSGAHSKELDQVGDLVLAAE